jgi:hypothetical protein
LPADVGKRYRVTGDVLLKLNQISA